MIDPPSVSRNIEGGIARRATAKHDKSRRVWKLSWLGAVGLVAQPQRVRVVLAGVYVRERLFGCHRVGVFVGSGVVVVSAVAGLMAGAAVAGFAGVPKLPRCGAQPPAIKPQTWGPAERELVPPDPVHAVLCSTHVLNALPSPMARQLGREFDAVPAGPIPPSCSTVPLPVVVTFAYSSGHTVSVGADLRRLRGRQQRERHAARCRSVRPSDLRLGAAEWHATTAAARLDRFARSAGMLGSYGFAVRAGRCRERNRSAPWRPIRRGEFTGWTVVVRHRQWTPTHGVPAGAAALRAGCGHVGRDVRADTCPHDQRVPQPRVRCGTHHGRALFARHRRDRAYVLSVPGVEDGSPDPVVGTLSIPNELVDSPIEVITRAIAVSRL